MKVFNIARLSALIIIMSSLLACSQSNKESKVIGQINGMKNKTVYLNELTTTELVNIDSVISDESGGFQFDFATEMTSFFLIELPQRQIPLIMKPGETVKLYGDTATIANYYKIDGSEESLIMNHFENYTRKNESTIDSLARVFENSQNEENFGKMAIKLNEAFDSIYQKQVEYVTALLKSNPDKLASLLIISQPFGPRRVIIEEENFELLKLMDEKIMEAYPDNLHAKENHKRFLEFEKEMEEEFKLLETLTPGNPAPDFKLPDLNEDTVALSSLKGKDVLLYFWGALDSKSRKLNPELKEIYNKQKDDDFEIVAISIDIRKEIVDNAIAEDDIEWINLCDFRGMQTPVLALYRVPEVLPFFVLIDKDGIIKYRGKDLGNIKDILNKGN